MNDIEAEVRAMVESRLAGVEVRVRTPDVVDETVRKFCEQVSPGQTPVFLDCEPVEGQDQYCFPIVEKRVSEQGGETVFGWAIWIWPKVMIEAEFHGLWRDAQGVLHDIVPRSDGTTRVLFLPDPGKKYEGKQVNNIREALTDHPAVRNMIKMYDERFEFLNRGLRANVHRVVLSPSDEAELAEIEERKTLADVRVIEMLAGGPLMPMLQEQAPKIGRNDPCPCGSGKKFKRCHGA